MSTDILESSEEVTQKVETELLYDPAIPVIYPKEVRSVC